MWAVPELAQAVPGIGPGPLALPALAAHRLTGSARAEANRTSRGVAVHALVLVVMATDAKDARGPSKHFFPCACKNVLRCEEILDWGLGLQRQPG